jgi:hypothetical protein
LEEKVAVPVYKAENAVRIVRSRTQGTEFSLLNNNALFLNMLPVYFACVDNRRLLRSKSQPYTLAFSCCVRFTPTLGR